MLTGGALLPLSLGAEERRDVVHRFRLPQDPVEGAATQTHTMRTLTPDGFIDALDC